MILVDHQIKKAIAEGQIIVTPYDESLVNPDSLDIRLGGNFSIPQSTTLVRCTQTGMEEPEWEGYIDPQDKSSFTFQRILGDEYILQAREFILASLLEDITLPPNVMADIRGKSSLGRLGLGNSHQAGLIDGGWSGVLTIELYNYSVYPIRLTKGMKIGQMVFHKTETCEKPYGVVGRYQRQVAGQGSFGV